MTRLAPRVQHGPNECLVNRMHNCAAALYPDFGQLWPYLVCVVSVPLPGNGRCMCGAWSGWLCIYWDFSRAWPSLVCAARSVCSCCKE